MKKYYLLLCVLLCLFACPAYAGWVEVPCKFKDIKTVYVNTEITHEGTYITMWFKVIFKTPQKLGDGTPYYIAQHLVGFYLDNNRENEIVKKDKMFHLAIRVYDAKGDYVKGTQTQYPYREDEYISPGSLGNILADCAEMCYQAKQKYDTLR